MKKSPETVSISTARHAFESIQRFKEDDDELQFFEHIYMAMTTLEFDSFEELLDYLVKIGEAHEDYELCAEIIDAKPGLLEFYDKCATEETNQLLAQLLSKVKSMIGNGSFKIIRIRRTDGDNQTGSIDFDDKE